MFEAKLIALYFYVCERYGKDLKYDCERFSNNSKPQFTNQEALTIYLYTVSEEKHFKIKAIHSFASRYLRSWFPRLPSYQAFNNRLNRLHRVLQCLGEELLDNNLPQDCSGEVSIVDSLPIVTCSAKRQGKVAREVTAKGYCSTKDMYYYGLKIHTLAWQRPAKMPWIEGLVVSSAAENDLVSVKK